MVNDFNINNLFNNAKSMGQRLAQEGVKNIKQLPSTYVRPDSLRNVATTAKKANTVKGLALGLALEGLRASNPFVPYEEMARRSQNTTGMKAARYIYNLIANNKGNGQIGDITDTNTNTNNQGGSQQQGGKQYGYEGLPPIEELINNASQGQVPMDVYDDLRGIDIQTLDSLNQQPNQQPKQQTSDISSILQAYQAQQQELNKPYIDALQNYINNYGDYMKGSRNAQRFYTALAGLSGNQGYKDLAKQYDPNEMELNRIKLVKALQEAKAGNVGNINEIIGNMAIAQEMGLSPEAALANKNLLNAFTTQQKAQYGLQGRMYGADRSYNARVYSANLDNATRQAIANGRMDLALQLQQMKGNVSRTNALINAASFGATPEDVQAMLDYFGGVASPAKGLTQQGTAQPTKKQVNTVGGLFGD